MRESKHAALADAAEEVFDFDKAEALLRAAFVYNPETAEELIFNFKVSVAMATAMQQEDGSGPGIEELASEIITRGIAEDLEGVGKDGQLLLATILFALRLVEVREEYSTPTLVH